MNLELMLNQHKEALKSSDDHNNELAQKLEIAWEQRDRLAEALREIRKGITEPTHHRRGTLEIANEALAAVKGGSE
jgi:uncharacterized coiled-coil DUF342 family protein